MPAWLCSSSSQRARPAVLARRRGTGAATRRRVAAPGEDQLAGAAGADQLVVDDVRGHPDQRQVAPALPDDLVPGGERDEVGEPLQGHRVAVVDQVRHAVGQRDELRHGPPRLLRDRAAASRSLCGLPYSSRTYAAHDIRQRRPDRPSTVTGNHAGDALTRAGTTCQRSWQRTDRSVSEHLRALHERKSARSPRDQPTGPTLRGGPP